MLARIAMMAMTTSNSISVNPEGEFPLAAGGTSQCFILILQSYGEKL